MSHRLNMEATSNESVETFERDFDSEEQAKTYAEEQVRGEVFWTQVENGWEGLAPGYAFKITPA